MKHPFASDYDVVEIAELRRQLKQFGIDNQKLREQVKQLEDDLEDLIRKLKEAYPYVGPV